MQVIDHELRLSEEKEQSLDALLASN